MSNVNDNFLNEEIDEFYEEELADTATEDEQTQFVLSEAIKRIEQAKLYETLLKHQLFGQGSARPEVLAEVEKEIRQFVLSRLEVLLGMKQEKHSSNAQSAPPFSKEQIEALGSLADRLLSKREMPQSSTPTLNTVAGPSTQDTQVKQVNAQAAVKINTVKPAYTSHASAQPAKRRRKRSENVSQVVIEHRDGTKETIDQDYSQAVNPKAPPVRMPSQAQIDQMNAQSVARMQGSVAGSGNGLGQLLGQAIALSQQKNANVKEE